MSRSTEPGWTEANEAAFERYAQLAPRAVYEVANVGHDPITPYVSALPMPDAELLDELPQVWVAYAAFGNEIKGVPIFTVDTDTVMQASSSSRAQGLELPPLPFEFVVVEACGRTHIGLGVPGEFECAVVGTLLHEIREGELWQETTLLLDKLNPGHGYVIRQLVTPTERMVDDPSAPDVWRPHDHYVRLLVESAYLLTARGVEHVKLPRQVRRSFERAIGQPHPQAWQLKIGTTTGSSGGHGGRTYTCRWLVRGHWRTRSSGRRSWIASYVKGPAGLPWRSPLHPVRVVPAPVHPTSREDEDG